MMVTTTLRGADMQDAGSTARQDRPDRAPEREPSIWAAGWSAFAGTILILVGIFQVVAGLVAIANDTFYVVANDWVFKFDVTTWVGSTSSWVSCSCCPASASSRATWRPEPSG